jgi:hypothetical protein
MKFFDPRGDIEKTAHKLPHWKQGKMALFAASPPRLRINISTTDIALG